MEHMVAANSAELLDLLSSRLQVGDAILTGGRDPISRVIQIGSRSPYSHAAIVTDEGEVTEAYDYALTPMEGDDGVFATAIEDFLGRSGLRRILVLRPVEVDRGRLQEVATHLRNHSPGFPTIGLLCLAICGASGPLLRLLPAGLQHRFIMRQVRLAADGTRRMHCAETVARIYLAAGLALRFRRPRLRLHIEHLNHSNRQSDPLNMPREPRIATAGVWPGQRGIWSFGQQIRFGVRTAVETWRERSHATDDVDVTDLLLPGDFARAEPFVTVLDLARTGNRWDQIPPLALGGSGSEVHVPPTPLASRSA